jgi:hypothetical protein
MRDAAGLFDVCPFSPEIAELPSRGFSTWV